MRCGELYRVYKASARDPRRSRVFVVVSRQTLIDSRFSTAICAPIYSAYDGLSTQVPVRVTEGLQHESSIHCDELISIPKSVLTDFLVTLPPDKIAALNRALAIAVGLDALA
jgi:mRNA interferase MazF